MPPLTIRAQFPLGVFQGHEDDGSPARLPDTARLYSALVNAAGNGTEAELRKGQLRLSSESVAALSWLETHPPTQLMVPEYEPARGQQGVISYRDEGTVEKPPSGSVRIRKSSKPIGTGTALAGAFGWCWDDAPSNVQETIGRLCADVSCLGESDSPVVLTLESFEPSHELVPNPSQLSPVGIPMRTPRPGRLDTLEKAWLAEHPARRPSAATDRPRQTEQSAGFPIPVEHLQVLRYRSHTPAEPSEPWPLAHLMSVSRDIDRHEAVAWCVAVHRMLAARMGDAAPASITGDYLRGVSRPANRIAIQYLPTSLLCRQPMGPGDYPHGAIALMMPKDLGSVDQEVLNRALQGSERRVWLRRSADPDHADPERDELRLGEPHLISLGEFWPEIPSGWQRRWVCLGGLIPETRRQPDHPELGRWGFEQAALLSVGHVFREQLDLPAKRDYWVVVEAVLEQGVRVMSSQRIPDSKLDRYLHKAPKSLGVIQPYTASLHLGRLDSRALLAIGQSRHLGGGLLVPVDSPEEL